MLPATNAHEQRGEGWKHGDGQKYNAERLQERWICCAATAAEGGERARLDISSGMHGLKGAL